MNNEPQRKHIEIVIKCVCGHELHHHIGKPCPTMPFTVDPCPFCLLAAETKGMRKTMNSQVQK